jgi:cob(I)alamin adenosyltransferase
MSRQRLSKGYVQIYTGEGKGKTTAALGLALRAAGYGMHTYIGQFMKGRPYGELEALSDHPCITVEQYGDEHFIHREEEITLEHVARARRGLERAREAMHSGRYDLVVLDEINVALWFELFRVEEVLALLDDRPLNMEVILTGRRAPQQLIDEADLVTEMQEVKHYYQHGVIARQGIEW